MKEHNKIEDLRWVRVFTPVHIPTYLVDQVRDRDFTVDEFYQYQEQSCIRMTKEGPSLNPLNHLYVLANKENVTKGFVWFTIDALSKDICIHTFSMDKEYWLKGKAVEKLSNFIKEIRRKASLNKVYWVTNYPKHSERHGFKRSKSVLMEYTEVLDGKNIDGRSNPREKHLDADPRAAAVSSGDRASCTGSTSGTGIQPVLAAV